MDDLNITQFVRQIISESSFMTFCENMPEKVMKRKRKRLAKYLKKQIESSRTKYSIDDLKEKYLRELELKYSDAKPYQPRRPVYHDDIDVFISESEPSDNEGCQENVSSECSSTKSQYSSSNMGCWNLEKTSTFYSLKTNAETGNFPIPSKDETTPLPKVGKNTVERLILQNNFLTQRSRELTRLKVSPNISQRAMLLVDAAIFSNFFGFVDEILLETPVSYCGNTLIEKSDRFEMLKVTKLHEVGRFLLKNGEFLVVKRIRRSMNFPFEKCLTFLSYEAKILSLVDKAKNVVQCFGICIAHGIPSLALSFESMETLSQFCKHKGLLPELISKSISCGIGEGISCLHDNGVLHNMLIPTNICLRYINSFYVPVIIGFSSACRIASSKTLTISQCERLKDLNHLPKRVREGKEKPSPSSDIFSYGRLLQMIFAKAKSPTRSTENLIYSCLEQDENLVNDFLNYVKIEFKG